MTLPVVFEFYSILKSLLWVSPYSTASLSSSILILNLPYTSSSLCIYLRAVNLSCFGEIGRLLSLRVLFIQSTLSDPWRKGPKIPLKDRFLLTVSFALNSSFFLDNLCIFSVNSLTLASSANLMASFSAFERRSLDFL